jgi:hypothetical protein
LASRLFRQHHDGIGIVIVKVNNLVSMAIDRGDNSEQRTVSATCIELYGLPDEGAGLSAANDARIQGRSRQRKPRFIA